MVFVKLTLLSQTFSKILFPGVKMNLLIPIHIIVLCSLCSILHNYLYTSNCVCLYVCMCTHTHTHFSFFLDSYHICSFTPSIKTLIQFFPNIFRVKACHFFYFLELLLHFSILKVLEKTGHSENYSHNKNKVKKRKKTRLKKTICPAHPKSI